MADVLNLDSYDLATFDRFGISPELLESARVYRVTHEQARERVGVTYKSDRLEGIVFPYHDPERHHVRTYRLRRDHPERDTDGTPIAKYLCPQDRRCFYFAPDAGSVLHDITVTAVFAESEKAVLALTAAAGRLGVKLLAIGTGGCWGWKGTIGKQTDADGARVDEKGALPDFDRITWVGRDVVILFDANTATNTKVQAARRQLAAELATRGARVRLGQVPVLEGVNGPDDYRGLTDDAALLKLVADAVSTGDADGADEKKKESQSAILVRLARESGATFFHDDQQAHVTVPVKGHIETHLLRSKTGRAWLQHLYIDTTDRCPSSQAMTDAVNTLEALCLRAEAQTVYVRIAAVDDTIYIDLGDPSWRAVAISSSGWTVINRAPVPFRRPRGLQPLPLPTHGGSVTALREFVNVTDHYFVLFVAVLIGYLRGRGPYVVLVIDGEQGTAKSTHSRLVKRIIDPGTAPLRSEPKEPRDLMIAASNGHVLAFDNLSRISGWLSDCFCRLSTGGGFSTRMLFEGREEELFDAVRPIVVNGIAALATRPDLVSRAVCLHLEPITETARREEREFWAAFDRALPGVLGALYTIVSTALANEGTVTMAERPRMADFARWSVAAEPACPWTAGEFLLAYAGNRASANADALDGEPVADLAKRLSGDGWQGTARELLDALNAKTPEEVRRDRDWFKRPRQVADALRRLAPALRAVGVNVTFQKTNTARVIQMSTTEKAGNGASPASPASPTPETLGRFGDEGRDEGDDVGPGSSPASSPKRANESGPRDAGDARDEVRPLFSGVQNTPTDPYVVAQCPGCKRRSEAVPVGKDWWFDTFGAGCRCRRPFEVVPATRRDLRVAPEAILRAEAEDAEANHADDGAEY